MHDEILKGYWEENKRQHKNVINNVLKNVPNNGSIGR